MRAADSGVRKVQCRAGDDGRPEPRGQCCCSDLPLAVALKDLLAGGARPHAGGWIARAARPAPGGRRAIAIRIGVDLNLSRWIIPAVPAILN
eukprot:SAG31_NODE_16178_length_720_cov_0.752013_1_plen_91_part_10